MEGLEKNWRLSDADPLPVLTLNFEGLHGGLEQHILPLSNYLMILIFGNNLPVFLELRPRISFYNGTHQLSEFDKLWEFIHGLVLEELEFVVLLVEVDPKMVVEIAYGDTFDIYGLRSRQGTLGVDDLHLLKSELLQESTTLGLRVFLQGSLFEDGNILGKRLILRRQGNSSHVFLEHLGNIATALLLEI